MIFLMHAIYLFRTDVYSTTSTVEDAVADSNSNAIRRSFGMDLTELDALEMRTLLPSVTQAAAAGVSVNSAGHVVDPIGLQEKLLKAILATGAKLVNKTLTILSLRKARLLPWPLTKASMTPIHLFSAQVTGVRCWPHSSATVYR
jgi:hypothetical protein